MNLAKISTNGQVTIPVEVRRALKSKSGDKLVFFCKDSGEVVIRNLSDAAIIEVEKTIARKNNA